MNTPLISVLIPTYNVEKFVEEAIRSIMNQTYRNLEIIIVDDCSTDSTYEILEMLAREDDRIKLFRNTVNKKIVETLNFAIDQASGDIIGRMDGDDISLPSRIEKQFKFLDENPEIGLVGLSYIIINEQGAEIQRERYLTNFEKIKKATNYVSPVPHFWLSKKEVYNTIGKYRIPGAEDYDFILRAIDLGFKVSNLSEFLYLHRIRNGNTATSAGLIQKKSFRYIRILHKERITNSERTDSYSMDDLLKYLKTSSLEGNFYKASAFFHHKYIINKNTRKLTSFIFLVLAIAFSPRYLLKEKFNRFYYKRILNKELRAIAS